MRLPGEALGLRWGAVDFDVSVLRIYDNWVRNAGNGTKTMGLGAGPDDPAVARSAAWAGDKGDFTSGDDFVFTRDGFGRPAGRTTADQRCVQAGRSRRRDERCSAHGPPAAARDPSPRSRQAACAAASARRPSTKAGTPRCRSRSTAEAGIIMKSSEASEPPVELTLSYRPQSGKTPIDKALQAVARSPNGGWLFVNVFPTVDRWLIPHHGSAEGSRSVNPSCSCIPAVHAPASHARHRRSTRHTGTRSSSSPRKPATSTTPPGITISAAIPTKARSAKPCGG